MSTAADIIRRAMKQLGVLAAGETPSAEDQADALIELNLMLSSWANERLLVFGTRRNTYTMVPNLSPHTIGATGTFATTRPLRIDGAGVIMVGNDTELPISMLTDAEYRLVMQKGLPSTFPMEMWVEWTYPNANLWFWPVPTTAAMLVLYTWSQIASFAASDVVSLPSGYEDAMGNALAVRLAPSYGTEPSPTLIQNMLESVAAIKRTNAPDVVSEIDPGLLGRRVFNVHTG